MIHPFCYVALGVLLGQFIRWGYWEIRYRLTLRKANRMMAELDRRIRDSRIEEDPRRG